jgi:hypothetical protein
VLNEGCLSCFQLPLQENSVFQDLCCLDLLSFV